MTEPVIISVAPNGARKTKIDHPALPMTAAEIAREAAKCQDAGAALLHLHVRAADGGHLLDADAYLDATRAVRAEVGDDMIIQITTEAVERYTAEEQMAVVRDVKPEAMSLALRELVPGPGHESAAADFFAWAMREHVATQYILYTPEDARRFVDLRARGVIPGGDPFVLFVLGRYGFGEGDPAALTDLLHVFHKAGEEAHWGVCAFGPAEAPAALAAVALGGHPRVGFENNLDLAGGETAPDNAALVAQIIPSAALSGRTIANGAQARTLLSSEKREAISRNETA